MLTYLINVTDDLLAVSVVIGILFSYIDLYGGKAGRRILRCFFGAGFLAAGLRAYISNTRRLVGGWKLGAYGYGITLGIAVLLFAALIIFGRRFRKGEGVGRILIPVFAGLLLTAYFYDALPNVLVYPFKFDTGGNGILSTDYLFRLGGYLLGILVCGLTCVCAYHINKVLAEKGVRRLTAAAFLISNILYAVNCFARLMSVLTPRKIIDSRELFSFAAWSNNHASWYTYLLFLLLVAEAAVLFILSRTMKEPYRTNAEHRKQRAIWRSGKRYSAAMLICFVLGILCSTWFIRLNEEVIREAPVEEPVIVTDESGKEVELRVGLEMVSDGHLHRFGYKTADGYPTRFIVILKQENTGNYGIGMDACEICGEAGYYENSDGQVVCKKCKVVMNRMTIGMKGGYNPIIIDYDIQDGTIIIPVEEMVKNQSRFTR